MKQDTGFQREKAEGKAGGGPTATCLSMDLLTEIYLCPDICPINADGRGENSEVYTCFCIATVLPELVLPIRLLIARCHTALS